MEQFQDDWLLPHTPEWRHKHSSLKQRPTGFFFLLTLGTPDDGPDQFVEGHQNRFTKQLWFTQQLCTNHLPTIEGTWIFASWISSLLCSFLFLSLPTECMFSLSQQKPFNCWFCLLLFAVFQISLLIPVKSLSFFPAFNSLTGRKNAPDKVS